MEHKPNPPDHPEGRKEADTSYHARAWGRVPPAPHACGDGGSSPDLHGLAELQAGCPHVQGGLCVTLWWIKLKRSALDPSFLPQTSAGQAEKKCFCSEAYWKNSIFNYVLEPEFTCSTNTSHYLQEIYIHMTETSSLADCFKYKNQKYWIVDWHELSSYAYFRKLSKLLSVTDEKNQIKQPFSFSWISNSPRNTANILLFPFFPFTDVLSILMVTWSYSLFTTYSLFDCFLLFWRFLKKYLDSWCITLVFSTQTLLDITSDEPCPNFLLYTRGIIPTHPSPSSELHVQVGTDCSWSSGL